MSHAHLTYLSQKHFGSLDALRAISIALVIWHHTAPSNLTGASLHFGAEGVTLFFAVSGFLITTLLLRERSQYGKVNLKAFYLRRSLRIMPLYFTVLVIYVVLVFMLERHSDAGQAFFRNLLFFATYTSNLFVDLDNRTIFYFSWSLATEEQFYLIWPLLLVLARTEMRAYLPLMLVIGACTFALLIGSNSLSKIPISLLGGALIALALNSEVGFNKIYGVLRWQWVQFGIISSLIAALLVNPGDSLLVHFLCIALVAQCVVQEKHLASKVCTWRVIQYIGSISYGMYMLHMLSKHLVLKGLSFFSLSVSAFMVFPLTFFAAVFTATLSFRYFESYFLNYKKRFER